jgi:hypothetical protein
MPRAALATPLASRRPAAQVSALPTPGSRQSLGLEPIGPPDRRGVPVGAGFVVLVAGTGVDDQQRQHAVRVEKVEGHRHVAAKRQAGDHRLSRPDRIEDGRYVGHGFGLGVGGLVRRVVGLSVPAHVPGDELVGLGEGLDLARPHAGAGEEAVRQE